MRGLLFVSAAIQIILLHHHARSQNTVGLLHVMQEKSDPGYQRLYPHNQSDAFLLDQCGRIVHAWTDSTQFRPGNTAYLLGSGNLLKTQRLYHAPVTDPVWAGGGGQSVELRTWDNQLIWTFDHNTAHYRLHHDIEPMPNGNVLMIAWEVKSAQEAIDAGRVPEMLQQEHL